MRFNGCSNIPSLVYFKDLCEEKQLPRENILISNTLFLLKNVGPLLKI